MTSESNDGPDRNAHSWFDESEAMPPVQHGNQVDFLIDGEAAFRAMAEALRAARRPGDFIYIVNWYCDVDFPLPAVAEEQTPLTLRNLIQAADATGVMTRALLWKEPDSSQNAKAVAFLNGKEEPQKDQPSQPPLLNAAAIHDDRGDKPVSLAGIRILGSIPRALGAQHQKVLCVFAEGRLVSFCGGMDFRKDRITIPPLQPAGGLLSDHPVAKKAEGEPLHDVHCRITGPAAFELVKLFAEKWNDHKDGVAFNESKGPLIVPPVPPDAGEHIVQIGRTYKAGIYKFRPDGEDSGARMIAHAIRQARRFIYTECQYFTGAPALIDALAEALPHIEHLTVLLTHWELADLPFVNARRRRFLSALTANREHAHKVRLFTLQPEGNSPLFQAGKQEHTYVHSKVWIIDDEFAVIGSMNSNQRSWMHDSEVAAGIVDPSADAAQPRLPHQLRVELWQEHLNMPTAAGAAALHDGVTGAAHWLQRTPGARVRPYNLDERNAKGENDKQLPFPFPDFLADSDVVWDNIFDPD